MIKKNLFDVKDQKSLEDFIKSRIANAVSIDIYTKASSFWLYNVSYCIDIKEEEQDVQAATIITNQNSKIFINGSNSILVYVSDSKNQNIIKELDYISSHYFFAIGTRKSYIFLPEFFVMIFHNIEGFKEEINYGDINTGVLAYNASFNNNTGLNLVISKDANQNDIANALESYLSTNKVFFEKLLWKKSANNIFEEALLKVRPIDSSSENSPIIRTEVGNIIRGSVIELSYKDELRVYIGLSNASCIMQTFGEKILNCKKEVIQINLLNNIIIQIYQKNAPIIG